MCSSLYVMYSDSRLVYSSIAWTLCSISAADLRNKALSFSLNVCQLLNEIKNTFSYLSLVMCTASFLDDCRQNNVTKLWAGQGYIALFPRHYLLSSLLPLTGQTGQRQTNHCYWLITVEPGRVIHVSWKVLPMDDNIGIVGSCSGSLYFRDGDNDVIEPAACRAFTDPLLGLVHASRTERLEIHAGEAFTGTHMDRMDTWSLTCWNTEVS